MATFRNYDKVTLPQSSVIENFDKENVGLGLGGNPQDMTTQTNRLNDSKDNSGVTINPPQPTPPKKLNKSDFVTMMNQ